MKKKTSDGFSAEDLDAIKVLQETKNLTLAAAKKRYRKIQKSKKEGAATVDSIPASGVLNDTRLVKRQESLAAANAAATIFVANFRLAKNHYDKFQEVFNDPANETTWKIIDRFFKHRDRDNPDDLLFGKYATLPDFLKKEIGISKSTYYRIRNRAKHPLLEETNGGTKTKPPKLEATPSTAPAAEVLDGIDESKETPATPLLPETPTVTETPTPALLEYEKPSDKHLECKKREAALKLQLRTATAAAIEADDELSDASMLALRQREILDKFVGFEKKYGNLIKPEEMRTYLAELPARLRALDENFGIVTDGNSKAAAA